MQLQPAVGEGEEVRGGARRVGVSGKAGLILIEIHANAQLNYTLYEF